MSSYFSANRRLCSWLADGAAHATSAEPVLWHSHSQNDVTSRFLNFPATKSMIILERVERCDDKTQFPYALSPSCPLSAWENTFLPSPPLSPLFLNSNSYSLQPAEKDPSCLIIFACSHYDGKMRPRPLLRNFCSFFDVTALLRPLLPRAPYHSRL